MLGHFDFIDDMEEDNSASPAYIATHTRHSDPKSIIPFGNSAILECISKTFNDKFDNLVT